MALIAIIIACEFGDPNGNDNNNNQIIIVDDLSAVKKYADDNAKLNHAILIGDSLKLSVSYGGGCKTHIFKLIGVLCITECFPARVDVYLSHDAKNDGCEAYITEELVFDIAPLRERYANIYQDDGPIQLAVHEPGVYDIAILIMYEF